MKKMFIPVEQIKTDGLQMRAKIDMDVVREYAESEREAGTVFPPVVVFQDAKGSYWMGDGFHRLGAYRQNGKKKIQCEVHEGEYVDALKYALLANVTHGMRRTNADKAHAVKMAYENRKKLGLPDVPSCGLIAEMVGVSPHTVEAQLGNLPGWKNAGPRTGADGKTRSLPPPPVRKPQPMRQPDPEPEPVKIIDEVHREAPTTPARRPIQQAKDERGNPVPTELAEVWNRRVEVGELAKMISDVRCAIRKAQASEDPLWFEINYSSVLAHLDMVYEDITASKPWCVCVCQGIGCKYCKDRGLLSKFRFDKVVPSELKS